MATCYERKYQNLVRIRMNIYYHERTERIYLLTNNFGKFLSIIFSSATFVSLSGGILPESLAPYKISIGALSALAVTIINGISLAYSVPQKMNTHKDLRRDWLDLYAKANIIKVTNSTAHEELDDIETKIAGLSAKEPPANERRLKICLHDAETSLNPDLLNRDGALRRIWKWIMG